MSNHTLRIIRRLTLGGFAFAMLVTTVVSAQPPAKPKPGTSAPTPAPAPAPAPAAGQTAEPPAEAPTAFTYNPDGRRDPFISLLGRGSDPKSKGTRPAGVPGLLINEVSVKGIVRNTSGFVALIQGPDNKTYVVKAGDRLMDGTVKSIVQDAVVFSQDVNDPLSLVKQKEIRKALRSADGGRG
jgi:type IV pilus assembly protein PilP